MELAVGIALVVVGVAVAGNALGLIDRAAGVWHRPYTQGDIANFASSSFLVRFIGLLSAAAGIALVWGALA
ncbi:MAG TPA: hypothetical protein VLD62_12560 [Acidimicrobiia bacterium]|nr:hypothetical protein [Acidimicrobiia bacterium]